MRLRFWIWLLAFSRRRVEREMDGCAWCVDRNGRLYKEQDAVIRAQILGLLMAIRPGR